MARAESPFHRDRQDIGAIFDAHGEPIEAEAKLSGALGVAGENLGGRLRESLRSDQFQPIP